MGHDYLPERLDAATPAQPVGGRRFLSPAVDGQDRRFLERRDKEGARRMAKVMVNEMPAGRVDRLRLPEAQGKVMRESAYQVARRINDVGKKERVPCGLPFGVDGPA